MTKTTVVLNSNSYDIDVMSEEEIVALIVEKTGVDPSFLVEATRIRMEATASMRGLGFDELALAFSSVQAIDEDLGSERFQDDFAAEAEKWAALR